MGKKIARGLGMTICVLLFLLCVFMMIMSAAFGSEGLVGLFGYNLYLCEESGFEGLNSGAAVIVEQCEPYDIIEGNLILYSAAGMEDEIIPALGYTETITMRDGVYSFNITDSSGNPVVISESAFIGKAGWSSDILGRLISFSLTPWGICVMAVLPCLALIIFAIVKGYADSRPLPEILPQVKNAEEEQTSQTGISVKDGKAEYGRSGTVKNSKTADNVLFTYNSAKTGRGNPVSKPAPAQPTRTQTQPQQAGLQQTERKKTSPAAVKPDTSGVPSSIAAKRYLDNAVKPAAPKTSGATAELPRIPKKPKSDAFFAQSGAPQIGRGSSRMSSSTRAVVDLEDALASANRRDVVPSAVGASRKADGSAGRKSAEILAAKNREQLISDDDDSRDRGRYEVDDILAGIDHRRNV